MELSAGEFEVLYQALYHIAESVARRLRSAFALAASRARAHSAVRVHSSGRRNWADRAFGRMGPVSRLHGSSELAKWIEAGVNVSPVQFRNRGLVETVVAALANSGLPGDRLELEITESVLLNDDSGTLGLLHQLRHMEVRISLDDFGTGYSSLSYLRTFRSMKSR